MDSFKELVFKYLNETGYLDLNRLGYSDFVNKKEEKKRNLITIHNPKTEEGNRIKDSKTSWIKDDPSFIPMPKNKKLTNRETEPNVRNDAEFFADMMEKARKIPLLRIKMQESKINPSSSRDYFVKSYIKAEKIFDTDEGKRMSVLKRLYFYIKKNLEE